MSFIARYVYTYEEFVVVTEAPQCIRMTATWQDTDNKIIIYNIDNVQKSKNTIYNIDNCVYVQVWYVQIWNVNKNVWWLMMYNNSVVCSMFNVKCSWDGLLEGRNRSCVWSFWCSELCSVDQTVTVQRGRVLMWGSRVKPLCSLWMSTVPGEWGGLYQWFPQQSGLPSVVFWGQIW